MGRYERIALSLTAPQAAVLLLHQYLHTLVFISKKIYKGYFLFHENLCNRTKIVSQRGENKNQNGNESGNKTP